jgi:hydrogenase expression/formation protein HypC
MPGQIVAVEGSTALVEFTAGAPGTPGGGVRRKVALELVDEDVRVGDHVLVHVGFAIRRIAAEDLAETLAFFASLGGEEPAA